MLFLFTALYSSLLFASSFISSVAFFGGNDDVMLSKAREEVVADEAEALITSFEITGETLQSWDNQKENFESKTKYIAGVERYYSFSYHNQTVNFLETKCDVFDTYYSFLHVYSGSTGSWNALLADNSVIISKCVQSEFKINIGDQLMLDNGTSFNVVGICDGMLNSSKKYTGNLLADVFGFFVFVPEGSISCRETGYFQRLTTIMTNKEFSMRLKKWYGLKNTYNFNFDMSCDSIKNKLAFCSDFSSNNKRLVIGGFGMLLSIGIFFSFITIKNKIFDFERRCCKTINLFLLILYFVIWFLLAYISSKIAVPFTNVSLLFGSLNSFSINSLVMLIGILPFIIKKLKADVIQVNANHNLEHFCFEVKI